MPTDKQSAERERAEKMFAVPTLCLNGRGHHCSGCAAHNRESIIQTALDFAALAVEREREECAKAVCILCRHTKPTLNNEGKAASFRYWVHPKGSQCDAGKIWARDAERG